MAGKRRTIAMLLAGIWTVGLAAGCDGIGAQSAAPMRNAGSYTENGKPVVTVITKAMESNYWNMVQAGAILEGEALGYTIHIIGPNSEENVQAEMDQIVAAQEDSAAMVIAPNDPNILVSTIADAHSAGIPIVIIDSNLTDETAYDAFAGTNNYEAGKALGEFVGTHQSDAVVAVITGAAESKTHKDRADGIIEGVESNGGMVLDKLAADSDRSKAIAAAQSLLDLYPELTAIIATSDDMALGAYEVVASVGKADAVRVYGFDASVDGLRSIIRGELTAAAAQYPIQMGRDGVALADRILRGEAVEKNNETPFAMVSKENAEDFLESLRTDLEEAGMKLDF
ncbi:MAG: sugar ABC transporter substrate-binding protein [Eubacteriales bacterium]|nr:sugar ABC transporter substrate-binding protein [Eubacteriales bacterium]